MRLDQHLASRMAAIALGHVTREYPHKLDHVLTGDGDARTPRVLHPIFYGSFDWHSCVHGWWTLLTLRRLYPAMPEAKAIDVLANKTFTTKKVAAELAYLDRPGSAGFERPYGWAWFLALHAEAMASTDRPWSTTLDPLADAFAERFFSYLPKLTYPIRVGTHFNSAFALILALDWAQMNGHELETLVPERAILWFGKDIEYAGWEPGGDEFLSGGLVEAVLMNRVLDLRDFISWFEGFLPGLNEHNPKSLFTPATVSDRSDGKIAHLDGLNLSRAWCWRSIAPALPPVERSIALAAADNHLAVAMPHISGDYMGEHWLASFALLALLAD